MSETTRYKILEAIEECDRFIEIEERRSGDLRPAEIQKTLDFYRVHKARLLEKLG